ncbi:MAG: MFS transporter [Alphaproteobacteria bacterium]|nr:MFS transporter [Alphaproteobacteria bacterium]
MKPWQIISVMCAAHVFSMAGFATFPALLPTLVPLWQLSNTQAGWISGIFFAGYVAAVPLLVTLTDRVDSRRIYLVGLLISTVGLLGFAFAATGFWSAMIWQAVQGAGIGGTYMTGLRMLTDRLPGTVPSRAIAFYTGAFSVGTAMSFVLSGEIASRLDWQTAFGLAALGPIIAAAITLILLAAQRPDLEHRPDTHLLDFRPVFRNRQAMAFTLGYAGHSWELMALRGWIVAFLVFAGATQAGTGLLSATLIAGAANLLAVPASIIGNEFAERFGRRRTILAVMILASVAALATGFSASVSLTAAVLFVIIYSGFVMGDSASLTAGAAAAAAPGYRGATLAVHSILGFSGALIGPLVVGLALDMAGGQQSPLAWIFAFAAMGFGSVAGAAALWQLDRSPGATHRTAAGRGG